MGAASIKRNANLSINQNKALFYTTDSLEKQITDFQEAVEKVSVHHNNSNNNNNNYMYFTF